MSHFTSHETIAAETDTPLFIFGDHASKFIPPAFDNLGLSGEDLTRHIAWDIGTDFIIRKLCETFECGAQIASVSRLVIDMNRDPDAAGLIPPQSDGSLIPANQNLSADDARNRCDTYYTPYHAALGTQLKQVSSDLDNPLIISLHSFTPHPLTGEERETDIGLLVKHDFETAERFVASFEGTGLSVKINKPYSAYELNHTVDMHVAPLGLRHLAIEIRQDHIDTDETAAAMADLLTQHIRPLLGA
ncbi:MAG: N-formylglutamate amidohydrolase [Maricaulaceae bacterium]